MAYVNWTPEELEKIAADAERVRAAFSRYATVLRASGNQNEPLESKKFSEYWDYVVRRALDFGGRFDLLDHKTSTATTKATIKHTEKKSNKKGG